MKKLFLASAIFATFTLFTACGDDSSSGPEASEENSSSSIATNTSSSLNDGMQESSSSEAVAEVMSAGYYEKNCPAGHNCRDAAPSTYLKSGFTYGEILDTRDDQVYKVVVIGEGTKAQTWMAQNLNYAYNHETAKSYCYGDDQNNCDTYGRLYTWAAAVETCPSGWHLPSKAEWETLFSYVGNEVESNNVGTALKTASGWVSQTGDEADRDAYGFAVLPAGGRDKSGDFGEAGYSADFWSSTESDDGGAYYELFVHDYSYVEVDRYTKDIAFSVRCLRD